MHDYYAYELDSHQYGRYDIDTDIETIYANHAGTCDGMVPTKRFRQMTPEGHMIWASLPDTDYRIILGMDSSSDSMLTESFGSSQGGRGGGRCRCGTFMQTAR